jgi:hypothetical protein
MATKKTLYRSAKNGRFITKKNYEKHPSTTVKEKREVHKPKKK